jgi:hypothetical protein
MTMDRAGQAKAAGWAITAALALAACGGDNTSGAGPPDGSVPQEGSVPPDGTSPAVGASVLMHHLNPSRDGHYIDALMTPAAAASLHVDTTFDGTVNGPVWAQPLYVENGPGGKGVFIVASDSNDVYALDETTGKPVWQKNMGMPADNSGPGCGNVKPIGITGTPVIDLGSRSVYLNAGIGDANNTLSLHVLHALSIDDGSERVGWPVTVNLKSPQGVQFSAPAENQRGALAFLNGYLYVPYGGHDGDCGNYHGWVVSLAVNNPTALSGYSTSAALGGMWAVGGIASDGTDVFVTSGNTSGASTWGGGEAVLRFHDGTAFDGSRTTDFFYPSDWQNLDAHDTDLGGTGAFVVDVPGASPSSLMVALGKNGVMYLIDRTNLGGKGKGDGTKGEGIFSAKVAGSEIITAAAAYTTASGTYVVFHARGGGTSCATGSGDLIAVKINATSPPTFTTAWCQDTGGDASPIVTTTDSTSNPIVWVVGAEGTNKLKGWDGVTGANVYNGGSAGDTMTKVIHFSTLIDVKGRLFVGASDRLYAFTSQ